MLRRRTGATLYASTIAKFTFNTIAKFTFNTTVEAQEVQLDVDPISWTPYSL